MTAADVCVIGGGIAGVSAACELAERGLAVALVEQEAQLAHHTTGRSAAAFLATYGAAPVRALTRASRPVFAAAPERFGTPPLLSPRALWWVAPEPDRPALEALAAEVGLEMVEGGAARAACPVLRPEAADLVGIEADASDIDVLALHQGYLRALRRAGGAVLPAWPVRRIERAGRHWRVVADERTVSCAHVVVAAGAWGDEVARLAGARPLGLQPLRRTLAVCPAAVPVDPRWPLVCDVAQTYYWKPEGHGVLVSPAEETPSPPGDARADELDVALALERVAASTTLGLRSVRTAWAGLRTFAPDRVPVCGPDPEVAGLWWLVGQGGYGIQTAPAMAAALAGLLVDGTLPPAVAAEGVDAGALAPARLTR